MSQSIALSNEITELLKRQAAEHGLTVGAWVEKLAQEREHIEGGQPVPADPKAAAARIREIRSRVRPDPEGWTIRDYIQHGRR